MSLSFTFTGRQSELSEDFYPPIKLDSNKSYAIGLIDFQTYNSIPNIEEGKNKFYIGEHVITFPVGQYEVEDLTKFIKKSLHIKHNPDDSDYEYSDDDNNNNDGGGGDGGETEDKTSTLYFSLLANANTLKCNIKSSMPINFKPNDSIRDILGFDNVLLAEDKVHESSRPVNISEVNVLQIECNIATGSYKNGQPVHMIHEFFPQVPPGFKIVEVPTTIIYSEVNTQTINNITIRISDQKGQLINFRGEEISLRLHLKAI